VIATALADWATALEPTAADEAQAAAALLDTLAVAHGQRALGTTPAARLAFAAHVLDFDDLHLGSTSHISAVCVPAVLAAGGGAREYLAAAGVMARLGTALGWEHYARGWHATCTAGALAAAAGAALARPAGAVPSDRADPALVATAMALAVPAAGGVQRAFGTDAKALQVGFAVEAGLRAAELAAQGATADPSAVDAWLELLGGDADRLELGGPAIPGGLAVKLYPCCYALQRPIEAARSLRSPGAGRISVRTPESSAKPLIHARPRTGLEGKFSLEYAIAATLLDGTPGFAAFSDAGVARPEAQALVERIDVELTPGGEGLLDGVVEIEAGGERVSLGHPLGSPQRPASAADLDAKVAMCGANGLAGITWARACEFLSPV
jgi:2-methylcitrate dehydratase PrpD